MDIEFEYEEMLEDYTKLGSMEWDEWGAGGQLNALEFYIKVDAEVIWSDMDGNWQGDCFALIKYKGQYVLWRDSFGSCAGCDSLDGCDLKSGYEYIKSTLNEGNCRRFLTLDDVKKYATETEDFLWDGLKSTDLFTFLRSVEK